MGETVLVMTIRQTCEACRRFSASLGDPRLQTALFKVRLVRLSADVFNEDLDALKIPYKHLPGFSLLTLDLLPADAIDSSEWDDDVPENIAPVLGAFVRGKYHTRRQAFEPVLGSGIRL